MAIVVNSKFRPFSYDEMLKMVLPAVEEHRKIDEELGNIDVMSSVWEKLKDSEIDKDVYNQYQNFQSNLQSAIDDLAKNGLNANSRRTLGQMKARYAKEIVPIEEAYNRRNALADEQRKAMLNDDSLLRQRVASEIGLREIMNNPSADYGRMVSGNKLTARVAQSASALANEYSKNPAKLNELLGGDYLEYVKDRGYSKESILTAMTDLLQNNDPNAPEELKQIVYNVVNSAGIDSSWNDDAYTKAMAYAAEGLWQAIGKDEAQIMQNWRKNAMVQNSLAMSRDAANSDRELNKLYLTQTAVPYMKKDGTVGYYEPITRTKNSKGGYDYSRNELPDDAVPGNPKGSDRKTPLTPEEKAENNLEQKEYEKLANVTSYDSMVKTGYRPLFVTAKHKNTWESLNEDEDMDSATGGYNVDSNLLTKGNIISNMWKGDATFKPRGKGAEEGNVLHVAAVPNYVNKLTKDMSLIEIFNTMYPNIPSEAMSSMVNKMVNSGIIKVEEGGDFKATKAFEIFKVRSERGNGVSGEDWDYMLNIKD